MYTDIFGNDLTEYELEVIADSGLARAQWEQIGRQAAAVSAYRDQRSTRHWIVKALKGTGVAAAAISALSKLTYNWATKRKESTEGKRLRDEIEPVDPDAKRKKSSGIFEDGNPTQSLLNLQSNAQPEGVMGDSVPIGSGNAAGLKETPIDRVGHVERGPPDFTFASLPYVRDIRVSQSSNVITQDEAFRYTSPLDPSVSTVTGIDLNAGTGFATVNTVQSVDASDTIQNSARWWDFYASMYQYYHVIGAKWHMMIENLGEQPIWVHKMDYNDEVPPTGATNEDIMCWKDAESHYLGTHFKGLTQSGVAANESISNVNNVEGNGSVAAASSNFQTGNNIQSRGASPILKLSGKYTPGKSRQIHLDSEIENWTNVNANPALPERVLFRFKPYWNGIDTNDATNYGRQLFYRYTFKIDYLVEFKELRTGLRWPVERQPLFAAISNNIEEDDEI